MPDDDVAFDVLDGEMDALAGHKAEVAAELGFSAQEARQYQAESQALINQTLVLEEQLMGELASR